MTQQRWQRGLARAGIVALIFALVFASFSLSVSELEAQAGPTVTNTPEPEKCPGNQIDVDPDFYNADCRGLDTSLEPIANYIKCDVTRLPAGSFEAGEDWGKTSCYLTIPERGGVAAPPLVAFPGCLDVSRKPWPRALAGRPLTFTLNNTLLDPGGLLMHASGVRQDDATGWYTILRQGATTDVGGNFLGEAMSAATSAGWDTRELWPAGVRPTTYPSVAYIRARLVLRHIADETQVLLAGEDKGAEFEPGPGGYQATLFARRSSASGGAVNGNNLGASGAAGTGPNNLPAYRVLVLSTWWIHIEAEVRYRSIINNAPVLTDWTPVFPSDPNNLSPHQGGGLLSYRAWDSRIKTTAGVTSNICRATDSLGYQPIAVLEGQSILK